MPRPFRSILAGTLAAASLAAAVPAAQAATHSDPNEPIICIRCGLVSPIQPGWVVNPPLTPIEIGPIIRP
jgi:hypothetical protein